MADRKFTLLELHLGDGSIQIGPASIGDETPGDEPSDHEIDVSDGEETAESESSPGRTAGKLLLVIVVLAVVAAAAKALTGSDGDLDELEDLSEFDE